MTPEETHFELGFSVTLNCGKTVLFKTVVEKASKSICTFGAVIKGLGAGSMKNHGIKQSKLDSVVKSSGCRYVERASSFDILV